MTCVVALTDRETKISYIGGERGASDDSMIWHMSRPKVWRDKGYLFGFVGIFAIEKIKHNFDPPPPPTDATEEQLDAFMNTTFIDALHSIYEDCHILKHEDGGLIVVVNNRIFIHNSEDMSMTMIDNDYISDGSGSQYATGSLYTSQEFSDEIDPSYRVRMALEAAVLFSPSCAGTIDIISTEDWDWEAEL